MDYQMKPIQVLYDDKNIIVVHKPSRMMVYEMGEPFRKKKCLLSRLEASYKQPFYPVHWLDRACSGIVIMAKNSAVAYELSRAWAAKDCVVKYQVLVKGQFRESGEFDFPLRDWTRIRQPAITRYRPIGICGPATLMEVQTDTDCRHQIRRHFSRRCANIIGDRHYGQGKWNLFFQNRFGLNRIFMHLSYLEVKLKSYQQPLQIVCPLPDELTSVIQQLAVASSFMDVNTLYWGYPIYNAFSRSDF